jgi:hypothetical protein
VRLRAHLPPVMAARLALGPEELKAPMHPSQVAFLLRAAATSYTVRIGGSGPGRMAEAKRISVAPRLRPAERLAARAEANARAPWKAAIAFARSMQRSARAGKRTARAGAAGAGRGETRDVRSDAVHREVALRVAGLRPVGLPAGGLRVGGLPAGLAASVARQAAPPASLPAPASPRGRATCALPDAGDTPMRRPPREAGSGGAPGAVRRLMRLTLTEASAPRSTALACTWMPRIKPARAAPVWRKAPPGPRVPPGSHVSPASRVPPPAGVAAVLRAGCVQQFHRK